MKYKMSIIMAVFFLLVLPFTAQGALFTFSGTDAGGTGSATMDITISGNQLVVVLENTSPVDLNGGSNGGNSPGISGFGFDLNPDALVLISWSLTDSTLSTIGDDSAGLDWQIGTNLAGVNLDYLPNNGGVADGMLFNPAAASDPNNTLPGGSNDIYFTTATLTMNFNTAPTLALGDFSPFVRMQNVGNNGAGSLKLFVPEPTSMLLLGIGLIGLATVRRRKWFRKN